MWATYYAEAKIIKNFTLKSSFGIDAAYNKTEIFTPAYLVYYPDGTPSQQQNVYSDLYKKNNENLTWLWENTLNFNKTIQEAFHGCGIRIYHAKYDF